MKKIPHSVHQFMLKWVEQYKRNRNPVEVMVGTAQIQSDAGVKRHGSILIK